MTQEEKAKAYDEALGWMREMYPCLTDSLREDAEHFFPELNESEDERIRQWLYDLVDNGEYLCERPFATESILAYLEKQKSVQSDTEKEYVRTLKSLISDFLRGKQEVDRGYYQQIYDWLDGRHVEQKEQKLIEFKENDERRQEIKVTEIIESLIRIYGRTQGEWIGGYDTDTLIYWVRTAFDCLNKQNIQQEQKPAEKPDLVVQLKEHLANTPKEQLEKEWKELEPWGNIGPTVQEFLYGNPAEWSEEDEKMLEIVIANYEYMFDKLRKGDDSDGIPDHILIMDWLKSLPMRCPKSSDSWKPSEEQMEALDNARFCKAYDRTELDSLYEQLKKLM